MSTEEPLGALVDEIAALVAIADKKCRSRPNRLSILSNDEICTGSRASSNFETVIWDIITLRQTLQLIKNELSTPESNIRRAQQAKREALSTIIESYRPLVQQVEQLAANDESLKKKRIWRSHKQSKTTLDRLHRELQFQTQTINLYLSTLTTAPHLLSNNEQRETVVQDSAREGGLASATRQAVDQEPGADAQWSLLRRMLVEDGITDIDIEAHTSSIRALLKEKLPSYYDLPSRHVPEEANDSPQTSAGSRGRKPYRISQEEPTTPLTREGADHGLVSTENNKHLVPQSHGADPAYIRNNAQGQGVQCSPSIHSQQQGAKFYIGDR